MKICIVDDKDYLRRSLKDKLHSVEAGFEILFEAANGVDFIEKMKASRLLPDVVLMDIEMPEMNGIEAIQITSSLYPSVKFLMLTVVDDDDKIFSAIKSGAHGYLLKEEAAQNLADAVHQVYEDEGAPMSPAVARKAWKWLTSMQSAPAQQKISVIAISQNQTIPHCLIYHRQQRYYIPQSISSR